MRRSAMSRETGTLLVIHTAYPFKTINERKMAEFLTMRDHSQFFDRVIHLNPVASFQSEERHEKWIGKPSLNFLDSRNLVIDGCVNRFQLHKIFLPINFIFALVGQLRLIWKLSKENPISLVRAEDPSFSGILSFILSKIFKVKLLVVVRGNPIEMRQNTGRPVFPRIFRFQKIEQAVEKFVLNHSDHTIFQNNENAKYANEMKLSPEKYSIQSIATGISQIHMSESLRDKKQSHSASEFKNDTFVKLITIARLEEVKLIDDITLIASIIAQRGTKFSWCIVGDGNSRSKLEFQINALNLEKNIFLVGEKSQEWIARELRISDIGVVLLAGRALVEMGLAGIAIAAYDTDWHIEFITHGKNGLLVPFRSIEQFADAIVELSMNLDLRVRLGNRLREDSQDFITKTKESNNQHALYKALTC